jgi:hypothetical protein
VAIFVIFLNALGDFFLGPLQRLGALGFILVSAVLGVALVFLWGRVSNQEGIRGVKRSIYTRLLESVLFRHDLKLSLAAQGHTFGLALRYLLLAVPPLIILSIPCILVLAQLYRYYGAAPVSPGKWILVQAMVADKDAAGSLELSTEAEGVAVLGPLREVNSHLLVWRVDVNKSTPASLSFLMNGQEVLAHQLKVPGSTGPVSGHYSQPGLESLLFPSPPLPAALRSIKFSYEDAKISLLGFRMHWVLAFFLVSLIAGLIGARVLKVSV